MMACSDINPRAMDVMTVREIYSKVVKPCIGRDGSWVSHDVLNAVQLLAMLHACM